MLLVLSLSEKNKSINIFLSSKSLEFDKLQSLLPHKQKEFRALWELDYENLLLKAQKIC